jgi:hypothetical protein
MLPQAFAPARRMVEKLRCITQPLDNTTIGSVAKTLGDLVEGRGEL